MSFDEYTEKYEILDSEDYYKAINKAFSIAEDIFEGREKIGFWYPKEVILGIAIQKSLDIVAKEKKEEIERKKARPKRQVIAIMDMYKVMTEYYYVVTDLEVKIRKGLDDIFYKIKAMDIDGDKKTELNNKHENVFEKAKEGMYNSDELQALLNGGEYSFSQEDIQNLMRINYTQREKFYVYCSLLIDSELRDIQNDTRIRFLNIGNAIEKFKEEKGKKSLTSIARGNLGVKTLNDSGKTLYDEFMEGMDYASTHILKGVNNGSTPFAGMSPSIYTYSSVDNNSFDSETLYARKFVDDFIEKNRSTIVSIQDLESLDEINKYVNERAYELYRMDDIEFLEYEKRQMHLSEEEKEMFEAKVSEFRESEKIYNGRGY